ncbi:TetR family transcriptional regulator [Streptomyces pactum]|uniref:TetR family transcriptional regulator n=1 Tax=Streptomyces pactum TaxID=68249 RepID=A0ABS0NJ59_9ACTN|nr:TetR family transcriptional regulator [Streptomyces pactum]MBH5335246.1 TetR family transcriptional regulator [Streptomyces pactum]
MSHTLGVREARKRKTRQALLDAALRLLEEQSLSSLGLREVTRAVGVAPAAFYRHFRDMADLGVALVEEALGSLHGMIRALLAAEDGDGERIEGAVLAVAHHVRRHPAHVRFLARERHGGVRPVREAIAAQLRLFGDEVAEAFAGQLSAEGWSREDIRMLAELYVDHMVMTATAFLEAQPVPRPDGGTEERPAGAEEATAGPRPPAGEEPLTEAEARIADTARRQMWLIATGRHHWRDG